MGVTVFNFNTEVALAPSARAQYTFPDAPNSALQAPQSDEATTTEAVDPVLSNCFLYLTTQVPNLPPQSQVQPNTTPFVGAVAIFTYISKTGETLPHVALVTKLDSDGFWVRDANFGGPGIRTHFIRYNDPHLDGFFKVK